MAYGTYDRHVVDNAVCDAQRATAIVLEASTGAILTKTVLEPITVSRFGFVPTVAFDYDTLVTEGVLTLYRYPAGVSGSKVALATIALEDDAAVGDIYFVDVDNKLGYADFNAGDQVVIEITTQAAGGTEVGDFQPFFTFNPRAEVTANQAKMHNRTDVPVTGNGEGDS